MTTQTSSNDLDQSLRQSIMEVRLGNDASYKILLEKLAPYIRRNVAAMLRNYGQPDLVEDITQEILLAVHLKLHTYDADQPFIGWVRAIMKHKVIDSLRRNKGQTISIDGLNFLEPADTDNPEIQAIRYDLQRLLARLKNPAGDIIYALKIEGASIRDIAAQYKMSEANVKVIIHRGLHKLSLMISREKGV